MSKILDEVLARLPSLSAKEREIAGHRLLALAVTDVPKNEPDWLFDGIIKELQRRGILGTYRVTLRDAGESAQTYSYYAGAVKTALLEGIRYKPKPPELISLGALAARALADDLEHGPAPISLKVLLRNTDRIPSAVEKSFPGYLGCGLLGQVIMFKGD